MDILTAIKATAKKYPIHNFVVVEIVTASSAVIADNIKYELTKQDAVWSVYCKPLTGDDYFFRIKLAAKLDYAHIQDFINNFMLAYVKCGYTSARYCNTSDDVIKGPTIAEYDSTDGTMYVYADDDAKRLDSIL